MPDTTDVASALLGVIAAVDGVLEVYSAAPAAIAATTAVIDRVTRQGEPPRHVLVMLSPEGTTVKARVAVSDAVTTPDTVRAVAAAVKAHLAAGGIPGPVRVQVEVSRIG